MAIVERIEVAEARHEDEPSGCDARDEVKAEEQPLRIHINDAVLLVTSAVQGKEKDKRQNDCGQKQNGPIAEHSQFLVEDGE